MDLKGFAGHSRLCRMSVRELEEVAALCRKRIIDKVSSNGGHLASNLGCVELTIALHKVFDPARTPIIFDVGTSVTPTNF